MLGNKEMTLQDYLVIARRRIWVLLIPIVLLPLAAYLFSLTVKDRYTSQTLVLVEQQKVPDSFVKPVVTEQISERLATMQEQILSRTRLQPIIERFGLFKGQVGSVPMEILVEQMRASISVSVVRADFGSRSSGLPGFYISFTAEDPRLAQQVCTEITSMFMEENLKAREQRAQGTTEFLQKQLEEAKRKLDEQDARLAEFKMKHMGQLPGSEQVNLGLMAGMSGQLDAATQAINRAQQDKTYAESMLAQRLAVRQGDEGSNTPEALDRQLTALQGALVTLRTRYTDEHPDVVKMRRDIENVQRKLAELSSASPTMADTTKVSANEPPEIRQLRAQIRQYDQIIRDRTAQQQRLQAQVGMYQSRIQVTPMVEEQFKNLTRDYHTALDFYNELLKKKNNSEMATDLERRQQGEQFRVMDPANLPERPSFPDRPKFALAGLGAGLALGMGLVLILEMKDRSLRSEQDVAFYLELPTLAVMPVLPGTNGNGRSKFKGKNGTRAKAKVGQHVGV
jgi:polysaccharide chain length determinant protein (PEP-CTERM system associated)